MWSAAAAAIVAATAAKKLSPKIGEKQQVAGESLFTKDIHIKAESCSEVHKHMKLLIITHYLTETQLYGHAFVNN